MHRRYSLIHTSLSELEPLYPRETLRIRDYYNCSLQLHIQIILTIFTFPEEFPEYFPSHHPGKVNRVKKATRHLV